MNHSSNKKDCLAQSSSYRPGFHITPPYGLLNDPNGFIFFQGEYHLFYQWNPNDTTHADKHWAHLVSKDLCAWKELEPALIPNEWYDRDGCYSGTAVVEDNKMVIFYTGNVKEEGERFTYQCRAVSEDGRNFYKEGPVVKLPDGYTPHFRDPKVLKRNNEWHMLVGARDLNNDGKVVLFTSSDLQNWRWRGDIAGAYLNGLGTFGYMWECPDLFSLEGQDVMLVSPQGVEAEGKKYNNLFQSGYFLGTFDPEKASFSHGDFCELDRGFDFYAPQTTEAPDGRRILAAWMGMPDETESYHPTKKNGWMHAMTIPRELMLKNNKVVQLPVKEMQNLRTETAFHQEVITEEPFMIDLDKNHRSYELFIELEKNTEDISLKILNEVEISFKKQLQQISVKRTNLVTNERKERACFLNELRTINIFIDVSTVEIFINEGEEVFSLRFFPSANERGIAFTSERKEIAKITAWKMRRTMY